MTDGGVVIGRGVITDVGTGVEVTAHAAMVGASASEIRMLVNAEGRG